MPEGLKQCPFCGAFGVIERAPAGGYFSRCSRCPCAFVMTFETYTEAVHAWNLRNKGNRKYAVLSVEIPEEESV